MSFGAFLDGITKGLETGVRLSDTIGVAKERKAKRDAERTARAAGASVGTVAPPAKKKTFGSIVGGFISRVKSGLGIDAPTKPSAVARTIGVPPAAPVAPRAQPGVVADYGVMPKRPFSTTRAPY